MGFLLSLIVRPAEERFMQRIEGNSIGKLYRVIYVPDRQVGPQAWGDHPRIGEPQRSSRLSRNAGQ